MRDQVTGGGPLEDPPEHSGANDEGFPCHMSNLEKL